jgi:D-sedoheptulose 7-phosphate isomerase
MKFPSKVAFKAFAVSSLVFALLTTAISFAPSTEAADAIPSSARLIGNGGNWAVATHGAADISRLTTKKVFSLDSPCYITSLTNDHGYEKLFSKWLEKYYDGKKKNLLIAFSGSGNSPNIIDALNWSKKKKNFKQILISGLISSKLKKNIMQISFNTKYFHTAEILSIMLFYEMVYQLGFSCPTISSEIQRKFK